MRPSVAYIFIGNLTIIGSDSSLSPGRRQAIIWTNDEILLIGPLGTNFSEILIKILTVSFKKMRLKGSSAKWQPFCLGLSVLKCIPVGEIDNKLSLVQVMAPRQIPYRPLIKATHSRYSTVCLPFAYTLFVEFCSLRASVVFLSSDNKYKCLFN